MICMEAPNDLKRLYKHWEKHCRGGEKVNLKNVVDNGIFSDVLDFAKERMEIWERKSQNAPRPWTGDAILNKYRFCNVYRELDRQTIEFHTLLFGLRSNLSLWMLNMFYCRWVCKPDTIKMTGLLSFDIRQNQKVYKTLVNLPRPKYGTAYVFPVSVLKKIGCHSREEFWCFYLPEKIKKMAALVSACRDANVWDTVERLTDILGVNLRFHLTELLIDVAYQYPGCVNLFDRFPVGPGAKPTLSQLSKNISAEELVVLLSRYYVPKFPYLTFGGRKVSLSAENWEGLACEFRKYSNLRLGIGRKRIFTRV